MLKEKIREALSHVQDPELSQDIVSLGMVREICVDLCDVEITIALTTMQCPMKHELAEEVRAAVTLLEGVEDVQIKLVEMTQEERARLPHPKPTHSLLFARGSALRLAKRVLAALAGAY